MNDSRYAKICLIYQRAVGRMSISGQDEIYLRYWSDAGHYDIGLIKYALKQAEHASATKPHRLVRIADKLLQKWQHAGIHTAKDLIRYEKQKYNQIARIRNSEFPTSHNHQSNHPLTTGEAEQKVMSKFGKQSDALSVMMSNEHPTAPVIALAKKCAPIMHCSATSLAKLFMIAAGLQYSKEAVVCAVYQYASELKRKPGKITTPAQYFLGILRHQVDGDPEALAEQVKMAREKLNGKVMPDGLRHVMETNQYIRKFDGLVYMRGWHNYQMGWDAKDQPMTVEGYLADEIRQFMHYPDLGYPTANELRPAVIVCDGLALTPSHSYSDIDKDTFAKAVKLAKRQCAEHHFKAVIALKPWSVKSALYVNLGSLTDDDIKYAKLCLREQKSAELRQQMTQSYSGLIKYINQRYQKYSYINLPYINRLIKRDQSLNLSCQYAYNEVAQEVEDEIIKHEYLA